MWFGVVIIQGSHSNPQWLEVRRVLKKKKNTIASGCSSAKQQNKV